MIAGMTKDFVQETENNRRATAWVAHVVGFNRHLVEDPIAALSRDFGAYSWITKAAVDVVSADDWRAATAPLASAFLAGVDAQSILGRLAAAGAISIDLASHVKMLLGTVTAQVVDEGAPKPVGRLEFDLPGDAPSKITAEIVCSTEALRSLNLGALQGVRQALRSAVAARTDEYLISTLTTAAGSPESSAHLGALLATISEGRPAAPVVIGGLAELLLLDSGVLRDLRDLNVTILQTPAAAGKLFAVDAAGLMVADSGAELTIARHATVLLDDGSSPMTTTPTDLWTRNLAALRCERWLRCVVRPGAVSYGEVSA
jgi:hypothetical protein